MAMTGCQPYPGTNTLRYCYVQYNIYKLGNKSQGQRKMAALHENGHVLSLDERYDDPTSVMYPYLLDPPITYPNGYDILLVNDRYIQ